MSETSPSVELLEPVEDVGGAAQPLLQVTGLTKHFPVRGDLFSPRKTVRAVDDVSFSIAKGETVGIVGESGCGKSTTARLLMHLMKRDAGDIVYDGMQVGRALSLARTAPRHADGVSGQLRLAQPAPDDRGIDRVRPQGSRHGGWRRARAGARAARQGRLAARNLCQPLSARDFRRPAPARQHRACAGAVAAARDPRRSGVGAGQIGRGAGAQPARRSQARIRPHLPVHQPRSQRGALHLATACW